MNKQQAIAERGGGCAATNISAGSTFGRFQVSTGAAGPTWPPRFLWRARQLRPNAVLEAFRATGVAWATHFSTTARLAGKAAVVGAVIAGGMVNSLGQNLSSSVTVHLAIGKMNLEGFANMSGYGGGPNLTNSVFQGNLGIRIRRTDDGAFYISGDSRTQLVNASNGQSLSLMGSFTNSVENTISAGVKLLSADAKSGISTTAGITTTTTSTSEWAVANAISISTDHGLIEAKITWTAGDHVQYCSAIDLGYVDDKGDFVEFEDGWLQGKVIIADRGPTLDGDVVPGHAPGKTLWGGTPGFQDSRAVPISAWVQNGWMLSILWHNGVPVSASIDPCYEYQLVGFRVYVSPNKAPNGKEIEY